jgi:pSer/pThr/pTyr-binding forkhead associated (FHA) protein
LVNWSEINRREVTIKAAAGLVGGIVAWVPLELWFTAYPAADTGGVLPASWFAVYSYYFMTMLLPAFVGMLIVGTDLQPLALTAKNRRILIITFGICFVLGLPAEYWSNAIYNWMLPRDRSALTLLQVMVPRSAAWGELGLLIGIGIGISTFSVPNIAKGAIGGLLGGLIGGLLFDPISRAFSVVLSRAFGLGETGLMIGLLIGLVQDLTKTAWLKVEAGRLRNREFRLEKAVTALGRAEECDVGLFGDAAVEARHAQIERRGNDFTVNGLGHRIRVNGREVATARLNSGDALEIGNYKLSFNLKSVPKGARGEDAPAALSPAPTAQPVTAPARATVTAPCLVDANGRQLNLRADASTSFGRATDNDVVLPDKSISRRHATIMPGEGGFYLRDLQSQNGTYVDDQRVNEYLLRDGDRVQLGDLQFTFRG